MGKISLRAQEERARRKVAETIEGTVIHQRQGELTYGRWDFAVFGPAARGRKAALRVGAAEQMMIQRAAVYLAAVGDPEQVGGPGMMTIEELSGGDIPDELAGLEMYHVAPLRPIEIIRNEKAESLDHLRDMVFAEFGGRNIAIIETPDEAAWSVSVLRYLHETDELLSDPVMTRLRHHLRDTSLRFAPPSGPAH